MTHSRLAVVFLVSVALVFGVFTSSSAHADLVAWYPFDGTAADASGSGHDGTLNGTAPTFIATGGAFDGYLSLPGVDEFVSTPDDPDFQFEMGTSWAASLWYRRDGVENDQGLITKGYHDNSRDPNGYWQLQTRAGGFTLDSRCCSDGNPRSRIDGGGDHGNNEWNHFVVTRDVDNDEIRLYVNGARTVTHSPLAGSGDWAMGANPDPLVIGNHFNRFTVGDFDDIGIWKGESLDDAQVALLFNGGVAALVIPEPSSIVLILLGVMGLAGIVGRRRRK
ncbi:MAG: PEP-CTERM sorting domain-containing protein [Planctomycetes bacterium]|nr:PEP-CTERM sorting domain-containing protein [Planctomycetota bacterium]